MFHRASLSFSIFIHQVTVFASWKSKCSSYSQGYSMNEWKMDNSDNVRVFIKSRRLITVVLTLSCNIMLNGENVFHLENKLLSRG